MESRLLEWAKQRAELRKEQDKRRAAAAERERHSHIPVTNHSRRRKPDAPRMVDAATVAGARLHGAGVAWHRSAALKVEEQRAARAAQDRLTLQAAPKINPRSKAIVAEKTTSADEQVIRTFIAEFWAAFSKDPKQ